MPFRALSGSPGRFSALRRACLSLQRFEGVRCATTPRRSQNSPPRKPKIPGRKKNKNRKFKAVKCNIALAQQCKHTAGTKY
eukprot:2834036-Alexandrium_andersonii.AAC.1